MTDPIPYADYVRIEVRVDGKTRVIEFKPLDGFRPQIKVTPHNRETHDMVFGDPYRNLPPQDVTMSFEVSGPQATISVEEEV